MADASGAVAVAASSGQDAPVPARPKFRLRLIALIRTAQGQNGVKHGDYARYRRHCKNKLKALYKTLKFQHGRTKYIKRKIEPSMVVDARFLHIPVFLAERAWAYAMEFKKQIEGDMDLQKRRHMIARLRKAASWGREVARLAAECADGAGAVEAQAYAAYLAGSELAERGAQWGRALALLTRSRQLLTTLSSLGGPGDDQLLYLHQVEEMEATLRYCEYQLKRQGEAAPPEKELLALAEKEEGALPPEAVAAALSALSSGTAAAAEAVGVVTLAWQGAALPVRPPRLQVAVAQVSAVSAELDAAMDVDATGTGDGAAGPSRAALYDRLIHALHDAVAVTQQGIKSAGAPQGDQAIQELSAVQTALTGMLATRLAEQAELQVATQESKFAQALERVAAAAGSRKAGKDSDKRGALVSRAEEVVRAHDGLLRALAELADVGARGGGRAGEELYDVVTAKAACVRGARVYYTAHYLLASRKPLEAYALFERAAGRLEDGAAACPDKPYASRTAELARQATVFRAVAHAEAVAAAAAQREGVEAGLGRLGVSELGAAAPPEQRPKWLLEALDSWESFAGQGKPGTARVFQLPFAMQAIPCRPIMLDTAANHLAYPSVEHRLRKVEKKGVLSSLGLGWGWGSKKQ